MNIGIVTSFLVGGLLLLSILFFNAQIQNHTQETTLSTITNEKLENLVDIISHDISRIGYQYTNTVISTLDNDEIVFWGDIFDNDVLDATRVTWSWEKPSSPVSSSQNPNDYYLVREGPTSSNTDDGITKFPVSYFNISYLNAVGAATSNSNNVKEIEIEIIMESPEPYFQNGNANSAPNYYRTVWKRSFFPTNLNKNYY